MWGLPVWLPSAFQLLASGFAVELGVLYCACHGVLQNQRTTKDRGVRARLPSFASLEVAYKSRVFQVPSFFAVYANAPFHGGNRGSSSLGRANELCPNIQGLEDGSVGLAYETILHLIALRRSGRLPDRARVVEIGAQQLSNSFLRAEAPLAELYGLFGRKPVDLGAPQKAVTIDGVERQAETAPASQPFWESLGFSYNAVEYGGHRGVTSLDLNRDHVPYRLRSSFDLVVNAGTTEHVVNQDNAFRVMHDLTKVGGVMMHEVPAGGMLTHGVVSYNPQFFWLLCRDNNNEVIDLTISHAGNAPLSNDVVSSNAKYARSLNPLQSQLTARFFLSPRFCKRIAGAPS